MLDIVQAALAADTDPNDGPAGKLQELVVDALWQELNQAACASLAATTVEDLLKRAAAAGLRRPTAEPINYVI